MTDDATPDGAASPQPDARSAWPLLVVAVIGAAVVAAGFAIVFRTTLGAAARAIGDANDVVVMMLRLPWWARVALPAAGGLGAGLCALRASKLRGSGGVGGVMEAIVLGRASVSVRRTLLQ